MYETRNDGLTKEPINKKNELLNKQKIFTWTFQLDNNKMEIQKQHHGWIPQEIALAFTIKFIILKLNILQIK